MTQLGFKSNTGAVREKNEDACFVIPSHNVYVVADGVGGNNAGEVASRTVVQGVAEYVHEAPLDECVTDEAICEYFMDCLVKVNDEVYRLGQNHREHSGMASTVVVAYIKGEKAYISNVGDSRAYLLRNGGLQQITEDHTYVNELLKSGAITCKEAEEHSQKHYITRAMGADIFVKSDFYRVPVEEGDILMLCSDGLYGEVGEQQLIDILSEEDSMQTACAKLVDAANENGGRDNITVVLVRV